MSDLFPLTRPIVPDTSGRLPDSVCCFLSGIAKEKASFLWGLSEPEKRGPGLRQITGHSPAV